MTQDFLQKYQSILYQEKLVSGGWFNISKQKLIESPAEIWIFVLHSIRVKSYNYLIMKKQEVIKKLNQINQISNKSKSYMFYPWVAEDSKDGQYKCWDARGLRKKERDKLVNGKFDCEPRDFSEYLNNWKKFSIFK